MYNPLQLALLAKFGCNNGDLTCELAKQMRPKILQHLLCEALKPGGEIIKIGGVTKSRADYLKALESVLEMTYRVCELSAEAQGTFAMHCHPHVCGEDLACEPRRHYGRRMW
jgi:hypothetical protein